MAVKKKGLGRGLDALFPEKSVKPAEKKTEQKPVAINEIRNATPLSASCI